VRRVLAALAVVAVVASIGTGVLIWRLHGEPEPPEISAYSKGHLTRVGPYRYCNVVDLNDCQVPQTQGELPVTARNPVQLSVPPTIGRAPWRLLRYYEDYDEPVVSSFAPNTHLAVTIPTVDPQRGRLEGFGVYLMTLALDPAGELAPVPHAEWFVRTIQP
jgi:Protein of unknown function (DUF2771)